MDRSVSRQGGPDCGQRFAVMRTAGPISFGWEIKRGKGTPVFRQVYLQIRLAMLSRRLRCGNENAIDARLAIGARRCAQLGGRRLRAASGRRICFGTEQARAPTFRRNCPTSNRLRRVARKRRGCGQAIDLAGEHGILRPSPPTRAPGASLRSMRPRAGRYQDDPDLEQTEPAHAGHDRPVHLGYSDPSGLIALRSAIRDHRGRCVPSDASRIRSS